MNEESHIPSHMIKLLRPQEAAEILGVTTGTLEVWRCTKRYALNFVKIGGRVMYRSEDILDFIQKRRSAFDT